METAAIPSRAVRLRPLGLIAAASLGLAGLSLVAPSTPSYDAWAWLIWGREVAGGTLDTTAGPAWKPLPVLVTTALAPFGAAPELWLLLSRAASVAAVVLVGRLAWRFSGGSIAAGAIAALSLLATAGFVRGGALGFSEGILVALVAAAADRHLDDRPRQAFVLGALAALLRPEVWPFLAAYGVVMWRRRESRTLLLSTAAVVPLLWFGPELWGSGELLRSSERARIPNPGQPSLAAVPALEVAKRFLTMVPLVATAGLVLSWRSGRTRTMALAGLAWTGLVAAMSQAGFAGEERYLLPAAACAAVAAGVAWAALLRRTAAAWIFATLALAPLPFLAAQAAELRGDLADDAALRSELQVAVARAGGADALTCGRLAAGRYRFPLVAWHLDRPISAVDFSLHGAPGTVLRSRLRRGDAPAPPRPVQGRLVSRAGSWELWSTCAT